LSVQKLIAEADRLLDKKKIPEAIEKFRSALKLEPMNQLVTSRLAAVYVVAGDFASAVKAYMDLGTRLSEAGKSAIAIAVFKQAIDLSPTNPDIKLRYARECEYMDKIGEAVSNAQAALQFYLQRKRYLDAANVLPMLVRLQPKDDRLKLAWAEVLQSSGADQKLVHFLVALAGPPGMPSDEFTVGGDPQVMSPAAFEALKKLVPIFPREPRVPYTVAWAAYRRGNASEAFGYLREALRRDPDFCLAMIHFATMLGEMGKKREANFVARFARERMGSDRSVDSSINVRLLDALNSKFEWLRNPDELGPELTAGNFKNLFLGIEPANEDFSNPSLVTIPGITAPEPDVAPAPALDSISLVAQPQNLSAAEEALPEPKIAGDNSIVFTSLIAAPVQEPLPEEEPSSDGEDADPSALLQAAAEPAAASPSGFNPLESLIAAEAVPAEERAERTEMFSPMEMLGAAATKAATSKDSVPTKFITSPPPFPTAGNAPEPPMNIFVEGEATQMFSPLEAVQAVGDSRRGPGAPPPKASSPPAPPMPPVSMFGAAPMEAPPPPAPMDFSSGAGLQDATMVMAMPQDPNALLVPAAPDEHFPSALELLGLPPDPPGGEITRPIPAGGGEATQPIPVDANFGSAGEATQELTPEAEMANAAFTEGPPVPSSAPVVKFAKIPQLRENPLEEFPEAGIVDPLSNLNFNPFAEAAPRSAGPEEVTGDIQAPSPFAAAAEEENVDMGDDLLSEPTRNLVLPADFHANAESTRHLLEEIQQEIKERQTSGPPDAESLMRRAERYVVKKNFYLARKALRHALALGAPEERVKGRLREIRRLERPDSLYHAKSSDAGLRKEGSEEILSRLEEEFGLNEEAEHSFSSDAIDAQIEEIFPENDSRTLLDLGVALHEMGLFRQAEKVFTKLVESAPEIAFDAYYLAAIAKTARRDFAGAVSILKKLSGDGGKSEADKIQVYYALGEVFEKMQRPESSREFFLKVAGLDANYRNVRSKLGS
jgi:tetratricopeptide (TPR) repeat protein